jgi:diguanylate cyclase (GGDEF)-like protein
VPGERTIAVDREAAVKDDEQLTIGMVLLMAIAVAAVAATVVVVLYGYADQRRQAQIRLLQVELLARRLSGIEWRAETRGGMTSELNRKVADLRGQLDKNLHDLARIDAASTLPGGVEGVYRRYESNVVELFRLLNTRRLADARAWDTDRVDPSEEALLDAIDATTVTYSSVAEQANVIATVGSVATLLIIVILLTILFWRWKQLRHAYEAELMQRAFYDPLTGLPNRMLFRDRLTHALIHAQRVGEQVAVLFIDLDDFKKINDHLGHAVGDSVLIEVARRLQQSVRADDTIVRIGGDEFTVLLTYPIDPDAATAIARRISATLRVSLSLGGKDLRVTPSIGIALSDPFRGPDQMPDLLHQADTAMYRAKASGTGAWEIDDGDAHSRVGVLASRRQDHHEL